uniref:Archease domain-containing protein n=1 Tax=Amblyomma triste TaxID=251400 RepID=A0A023G873_AMBTT
MSSADDYQCAELVERDNFTEEELSIPPVKYEYLDHTADVQLHGWGEDLKEAFEQVAVAMFGYMTEIDKVEIRATCDIAAEAEDMVGLLFHFLDELLFVFSAEPFIIGRKVEILEFDKEAFRIKARV